MVSLAQSFLIDLERLLQERQGFPAPALDRVRGAEFRHRERGRRLVFSQLPTLNREDCQTQ